MALAVRLRVVVLAATALAFSVPAVLLSQEPVISRSAPMTLTGEIVEISCYKQKGVAAGTGAAHVACAKLASRRRAPRSASSATATVCFASGAPWRATSTPS